MSRDGAFLRWFFEQEMKRQDSGDRDCHAPSFRRRPDLLCRVGTMADKPGTGASYKVKSQSLHALISRSRCLLSFAGIFPRFGKSISLQITDGNRIKPVTKGGGCLLRLYVTLGFGQMNGFPGFCSAPRCAAFL